MKNDERDWGFPTFDPQRLLCSWGIHRHNKSIVLSSLDINYKLEIKICPHCKCPSKKTLRIIFPNGTMVLNRSEWVKAMRLLEESRGYVKYSLFEEISKFLDE